MNSHNERNNYPNLNWLSVYQLRHLRFLSQQLFRQPLILIIVIIASLLFITILKQLKTITRKNITISLQLLFIFINGTDGKIVALVTISIFPSRTRYRLSAFPKNTFVLSCAVANCGASWFFYASIFASIQIDVGMFSKKWTFVVTPNIVGWSIPIVGGS